MNNEIVWRDDDVHYLTDLKQFEKIHEVFKKHNVKHTIAVIAKDLDKNTELIEYINSNENIDVQLHCWNHISAIKNIDSLERELVLGIDKIKELFGKKPTILYPPWNETNDVVSYIAKKVGLKVSNLKVSMSHFVKCNGVIDIENCNTINFHYWSGGDTMFLNYALELYMNREIKCI